MSQLIDRLCQMTKCAPQPMGFRTARTAVVKPRLFLISRLLQPENVDKLAETVSGADAVLFNKIGTSTKTAQKITEALADVPWGLGPGFGGKDLKPIAEAGCDFLVFPTDSAVLAAPRDENNEDNDKVGRILQVGSTFDEGLLRVLNELPIDAVYIADEPSAESFLTWSHVMLLQRFGLAVAKPLLVRIPEDVGEDELQLLWEVGMDGVVVEGSARLAELRKMIDKLTVPARPRRRAEAIVPFVSEDVGVEPETEEEEEEE